MANLTKNQRGRFDKKLKAHGYLSGERKAILSTLDTDISMRGLQATEISLGYFRLKNGVAIEPSYDPDDLEAVFCFTNTYPTDREYIGYPGSMYRVS